MTTIKRFEETKNNLHGFIAYLVKSGKNRSLREAPAEYFIFSEDDLKTS
ncbi:MAG: hypothetical protein M1347_00330 [Chloroflexi bacterium]|nr:hypothetical protein [Chloroflexota bacterium]